MTVGSDDASYRGGSNTVIDGVTAPLLSVGSKLAIYDLDSVVMETWSIGAQIPTYRDDDRRLIWTLM